MIMKTILSSRVIIICTRSKNTNADLRYECFPAPGEIISASVFYKYFDQPIEQTNQGNDVLSYTNADNANVYGVEVGIPEKSEFYQGEDFLKTWYYMQMRLT